MVVKMYWISKGFIFTKVDSFVHKLDPRVKLLISIQFFTLALLVSDLIDLAIIFIGIILLASISKILSRLIRTMLFALLFSGIILGINIIAGYSFIYSLQIALRFVAIVCSTSIFFLITSPDELEYVLRWFRIPNDLVFAFVTAVRFVPIILLDALQIIDAQKSRGLELERGNPITRIKNFVPILVPLIVNEVIRSGELAEAMESRSYGTVKKPTWLHYMKLKKLDYNIFIFSIIFFIFFVYYFVLNPPFSLLQVNI